jgi:outer membrane protein assembly factor BamB
MRFVLYMLLLLVQFVSADILSQWRGPLRNGIYPDKNLLKEWPANGPELLWKVDGLGNGFTSAAVTEKRVYVTGMLDNTGYLFSFDNTGKLIYKKAYGKEWYKSYEGTRSTPVVVDELIYLLSGQGTLYCLKANSGDKVWAADILKRFDAPNIEWGVAEQLLVNGEIIYCTPGGKKAAFAALNRFNGKTIWTTQSQDETSAYCSPILINHNSTNMIVTLLQKSIVGINADSGELLWKHAHIAPWDIHANMPIYHNGFIYFQSGEDGTGQLLKLAPDGRSVSVVWENNSMDTVFGHQVLVDGYFYGAGFPKRGFQALDWNTGKSLFEERSFSRANVIYADNFLYAYTEKGTIGLIKPNPKKFDLVSSFKITEGTGPCWAHLVINNGRLFVRHGDVLMVYDIINK